MAKKNIIEKLSPYRGTRLKTIIPKRKTTFKQFLGIRSQRLKLHKIAIESHKILFKKKKRGRKPKPISSFKDIISHKWKISRRHRVGDSKKPVPPTGPTIPSIPAITHRPSRMITSVEQVIWIKLSPKGKTELKEALIFDPRLYRARMKDIGYEMNAIYTTLTSTAAKLIQRHVPKDTGDLQSSLLTSMAGAGTKKPPNRVRRGNQLEIHVGFYSDIPYLKYVNKPQRTILVRHHRNMGIISYRGGRHYLHDPTAKTLFMLTTKQAIRDEARRLTKDMIRRLYIKWGVTYPYVKSLFKYPGMRHI